MAAALNLQARIATFGSGTNKLDELSAKKMPSVHGKPDWSRAAPPGARKGSDSDCGGLLSEHSPMASAKSEWLPIERWQNWTVLLVQACRLTAWRRYEMAARHPLASCQNR